VAKESAPYGIAATELLIVGVSAALSAAFAFWADTGPAVAAVAGAGGADAGVVLSASARTPTTEREDPDGGALAARDAATTTTASTSATAATAATAAVAATEASGPGFLTIITTPSAKLSVHGRVLCTATPCSKLALPAGQHTLTLEAKEDSSKTIVTVMIASGETTVKRVKLKTAPTAP
jgi:hypothetical protein